MFNSFRPVRLIRETSSRALDRRRFIKLVERTSSLFAGVNKLFYTEALTHIFASPNTDDGVRWGFGSDLSSVLAYNGPAPFDYSSYSVACGSGTDTGISATQTPSGTRGGSVVFKAYDTVAGSVNSKSLWNHNLLPYSNNILEGSSSYYSYQMPRTVYEDSTKPEEISEATAIEFTKNVPWNAPSIFAAQASTKDIISSWDPDRKKFVWSYYFKITNKQDSSQSVLETRIYDTTDPDLHSSLNIFFTSTNNPTTTNSEGVIDDLGNGWYRVSMTTDDTYAPNNTYAGDKVGISILWSGAENDRVVFAAPQLEQHPIRGLGDTNVYSGLDYAFEYDPDPHSGFAGTLSVWNVGNNITGSDTGFEYRIDPFGKESVVALLKDGSPDVNEGTAYNYIRYAVDRTTKHRVSFFFKRQRTGGTAEFGMYGLSKTKRVGDHANRLTFQSSQHLTTATVLNDDEWYLQVGYIHDTSTATTDATTGWYRLDGTKVDHGDVNFADLYFDPAYPSEPIGLMFRRFSAPHNDGNEIQIFGPRIDVVNGNEPSIEDLLNPVDNVNYGTVTKATPYVGNGAIPANVHRHNWLQYTDDLTDPYWTQNSWTVEASTVGTTIFNGETCLSFSGHPTNYGPGSIQKNIATSDLSFDLNERYVASIYFKQGNDPATAASAIEISCDDNTNPYAGYTLRLVFNTYGGPPARLNGSSYWGYEDVGDGWYRIWVRTPGGSYASKTLNGDQIKFTAGLQVQQNNHQGFFMRPMLERLPIDQAESDPPTAYQEVGADWPSELQIPYHQTAKRLDITLTEDTGTSHEYKGKFWWDGGYPYYYDTPSGAVNSIDALGDGWFRLHNAVPQAGAGPTARNDKIARFSLDLFTSANSATSALFAAPSLGHTGSEDIYKLPYEPGTNEPGVNYLPPLNEDTVGTNYIISGTALSSLTVLDHDAPEGYSGILIQSDEGLAGQQNRDQLYIHTSALEEIRMSAYDTIVAQLPVKSLWNYNQLPYTRNILDDPGFNYEGDTYGEFYGINETQYPIDATDKGPDGVSQALTFYNDHPNLGTRQFFDVGALSYIPSSTLHAWDENLVVNFSIHLKRPDNVEDTVPRFLLYLSDHTDPENTQAIYFDWGPSSTHPYHYSNNAKNKQVTFTDAGEGWYRVCWSVSGFGSDPNQKVHNGDKVSFRVFAMDSLGKSIKYAQPQIEFHTINDTNLLKPSWDWYGIQGPATINNLNGWVGYGAGENGIELREDPFGLSSLCWVGYDYNAPDPQDGGYTDSPFVDIDPNSTYRYSFFAKLGKEKPTGNRSLYAGPDSYNAAIDTDQSVRGLDGTQNSNPYMIAGINEGTLQNDWHLFVFHLQPSGTATPASNLSNTGVYRLDGSKIVTGNDMLLDSTTSRLRFRAFAWSVGDDDDGTDAINLWSPRVEKVDGTEPSITELLASGNLWTNPNYQQTLPSPYVENVGIHPNPHRHNWLDYTNDLTESSYWTLGQGTLTASTVPTTYANGETCFVYNMPATGTSNFILYGGFPGSLAKSWDEDNQYVASVYMKQLDAAFSSFNFAFGDITAPFRETEYTIDFNITDTSNVTFTGAGPDVNSYGYESLPEGWIRVWWSVDSSGQGGTVDGDNMRLYLYLYGPGASDFNAMYGKQGVALMRPMVEILPIGSTINNVPRAYQEVDGVWDLGVTSIPEHQCATALQTQINDYYGAASHVCSSTFEGGRVVDSTITTPQDANTSIQHLGDGWYNVIMSASGLADSRNFEGDRVRMIIYPTEFISDRNETCFGLIGQPFLGLTGDLNTSSVDYKP